MVDETVNKLDIGIDQERKLVIGEPCALSTFAGLRSQGKERVGINGSLWQVEVPNIAHNPLGEVRVRLCNRNLLQNALAKSMHSPTICLLGGGPAVPVNDGCRSRCSCKESWSTADCAKCSCLGDGALELEVVVKKLVRLSSLPAGFSERGVGEFMQTIAGIAV